MRSVTDERLWVQTRLPAELATLARVEADRRGMPLRVWIWQLVAESFERAELGPPPPPPQPLIDGPAMARVRRAAGLSQSALARLMGLSKSRISMWETGVSSSVRPGQLEQLASAFDVEPSEFTYLHSSVDEDVLGAAM